MGRPAAKSAAHDETVEGHVVREPGTPVAQGAMAGLPALVVSADGTLKFSTAQSSALRDGAELKPVIRQHVLATRESGQAQLVRVALDDQGEPRRFDLTLMPSVNGEVLVLARETSFE